jgi:hypothetical protein
LWLAGWACNGDESLITMAYVSTNPLTKPLTSKRQRLEIVHCRLSFQLMCIVVKLWKWQQRILSPKFKSHTLQKLQPQRRSLLPGSKLHITPIESLQRLFRSSSTKGANKPFRISTLTPHKIAECRRITSSLSSSVDAASNDDVGICRAVLNLCAFA